MNKKDMYENVKCFGKGFVLGSAEGAAVLTGVLSGYMFVQTKGLRNKVFWGHMTIGCMAALALAIKSVTKL